MIDAMRYKALVRDRQRKGNGNFTADEHKTMVRLERNLQILQAYLLKGTKPDHKVVGESKDDPKVFQKD